MGPDEDEMDRPLVDQPDGEYMQLEAGLEPQQKKNRWNPLNWSMRDKIIAAVVVVLVCILIIVLACTLKGHSSDSSSPHSSSPPCAGVQTIAKEENFTFSSTYTGYQNKADSAACKIFPPSSNDQRPSCSESGESNNSKQLTPRNCVACNTDGERSVSTKKFYNRSNFPWTVPGTVGKYVNKGIDCTSSDCACSGVTQTDCVAASADPTSETYCTFEIETKKNSTGSEFLCFSNSCGALTAYNCGDRWIAPKLVSPVPDAMVQILKPVNQSLENSAPPTGYWTYTVEPDQFGTFPAVRTVLPYCEDLISSLETVTGALVIG